MKISTVKEFRDEATKMMRLEEPVLITRHGKLAGIYMPMEDSQVPVGMEFRKQLQLAVAGMVRTAMKKQGFTEKDVLQDFDQFRKSHRRR